MVTSFLLQPRRKSGRSCNSLMATLTAIQHDNQNKKDPQGRFGEELLQCWTHSLQVFVAVVVGWTRNMEARSISFPISSRTKSYAARGNWETNRALTAAALLMWSGWLFTKKREKERAWFLIEWSLNGFLLLWPNCGGHHRWIIKVQWREGRADL